MTIRRRATVLSGGRIQIEDPQLPEGAEVLVTVDEPLEEPEFDPNAKPIWQVVLEIGASIPEEEWEKVPKDLSINLDHYLYGALRIVPQSSLEFQHALSLYAARSDKDWSFTDCASFYIMNRQGLTQALTHDRHFQQAGFRALLRD